MNDRTPPTALVSALRAALPDDALILEGEDLAFYGSDRCKGGWPVAPGAIALPRTVEQVRAVVRACAAQRWPIVPSGGRTGLAGAATATAGEVVLSLVRMTKIESIDSAARLLRCQAGATVEAVHDAAAAEGLMYPIDFAAKGSAQIGGTIATNAGGVRVIRYGLTRDWVQGLDVVLADGSRIEVGGGLVKNNTGYDLRQLFIGSEGTLGIIVGATLKLCPPPRHRKVVLCALPNDAAILDLFVRMREAPVTLSAFECFDHGCVDRVCAHRRAPSRPFEVDAARYVLIEIIDEHGAVDPAAVGESADEVLTRCLSAALEAGTLEDAVVAVSAAQERALWAWREDISESLHVHTPHKADVSVPVSAVAKFVEQWRELINRAIPDIPGVCFGHVGDGNLHLNLLRPESMPLAEFLAQVHGVDDEVYELVERHRGSISAEHGIGLLKRAHLHHTRSVTEVDIMRGIKAVLDPQSILNPGKIWE